MKTAPEGAAIHEIGYPTSLTLNADFLAKLHDLRRQPAAFLRQIECVPTRPAGKPLTPNGNQQWVAFHDLFRKPMSCHDAKVIPRAITVNRPEAKVAMFYRGRHDRLKIHGRAFENRIQRRVRNPIKSGIARPMDANPV